MDKKRRVLIIGLDGGTWTILRGLTERGYMPNLARLISTGGSGILKSTMPPITPVAWSSFLTGVNPGKHGVISFGRVDKNFTFNNLVDRTAIKTVDLFRHISDQGKRAVSINVPMTYPPQKINGLTITGLFTPNMDVPFTNPPTLKEELLREVPQYQIFPSQADVKFRPHENFSNFVNAMTQSAYQHTQAASYLLAKEEWDLFMLHFLETDLLQHPMWCYLDPKHPMFDEKKYQFIAENFYSAIDRFIGNIQHQAQQRFEDSEILTIVLSDHGFQSNFRSVNLQKWMHKNKWTKLNKRGRHRYVNILRQLDIFNLRKRKSKKNGQKKINRQLSSPYDLDKSAAISMGTNTWGFIKLLNINPEQKQLLVDQLYNLKDPQNDKNIIKNIIVTNEVFNGSQVAIYPDLILEPTEGYIFSRNASHEKFIRSIKTSTDYHIGTHHSDGIVIVQGQNVKPGNITNAAIIDMFPTILHYLGLEIPQNIDGKVLDVFNENFMPDNAPAYSSTPSTSTIEEYCSTDDEKEIKQRLESIGYL